MYDVPQVLPRSPQSTRSRMTSTPTNQSPMRLLSPTKSHATPSRTRQKSPRKSPARKGIFDTMSTQAVHFTPERTRQPPRAWERRPATPYVPRDDRQKIWKRVPLGEIGIESNRPANISRREQEARKDYARVVKKLKVGHGSDDEDKENVSLNVKIDCESRDMKRKPHLDSRFVSMKMEEDDIVGSPKKKLRSLPGECDSPPHDDICEDSGDLAEADNDYDIHEEDSEYSDEEDAAEVQDVPNEEQESVKENNIDEQKIAANVDNAPTGLNTCTVDSTFSKAETGASGGEQEVTASHGPDESSTTSRSPTGIETAPVGNTHTDLISEQEGDMLESGLPETDISNHPDAPWQPAEADMRESILSEAQQNDQMLLDNNDDQGADAEEPRSSSPPTILAENVVVDELESRNSFQTEASMVDQGVSSNDQQEQNDSDSQKAQETAPRRISDDEAAFLRNFVSNSKAERAAREKKAQDTQIAELNVQAEEITDGTTDFHESFEEVPQITRGTPVLEPSTMDLTEIVISSPLRRSKRAAITSIPRPQSLPNAIQLKRANGNEFIFTANKASSAANIAVVTRSNTKRNKGSALNVPERLQQLLVDDNVVVEPEYVRQPDTETSGNQVGEDSNTSTATKKRKREGKEGGTRAKKVLRWNDDKLVSYQEAKRFLDETEDIDDSSQESNNAHENEMSETDKHVKLTLTLTSSGSGKSSSKEETDSTSSTPQSKVRRVRRGTSGTVNGTPGPKTRSRRIRIDDDTDLNTDIPVDDKGSLEDSTAAAAAISELAATTEVSKAVPTKRSRMPMPVASSLGTRRGAAASASIRSGSVAMRAAAAAALPPAESKKAKETNKQQDSKEDVKGGDLLGKRRLRVRS